MAIAKINRVTGTLLFTAASVLLASVVSSANSSVHAASSAFVPLTPARVLDTRSSTIVGSSDGSAAARELTVLGQGGVPTSGVGAVAMNITVTNTGNPNTGGSYLTVYPCGTRPNSSNINFSANQTIANAVIAPVSSDGKVCFYAYGTAHIIADVSGYFSGDSALPPSSDESTSDLLADLLGSIGGGYGSLIGDSVSLTVGSAWFSETSSRSVYGYAGSDYVSMSIGSALFDTAGSRSIYGSIGRESISLTLGSALFSETSSRRLSGFIGNEWVSLSVGSALFDIESSRSVSGYIGNDYVSLRIGSALFNVESSRSVSGYIGNDYVSLRIGSALFDVESSRSLTGTDWSAYGAVIIASLMANGVLY